LSEIAREMLALAEGGLLRRARLNGDGEDETGALKSLMEVVETGRTQSDRLLAAYEGPWGGDINQLFGAEAM
jgi:glutamate--cysteine ligase